MAFIATPCSSRRVSAVKCRAASLSSIVTQCSMSCHCILYALYLLTIKVSVSGTNSFLEHVQLLYLHTASANYYGTPTGRTGWEIDGKSLCNSCSYTNNDGKKTSCNNGPLITFIGSSYANYRIKLLVKE